MSRRAVLGNHRMCDQTLMDGAPVIGTHLTGGNPLRLDVSNEREHPTYGGNRGDSKQYFHHRGDTRDR